MPHTTGPHEPTLYQIRVKEMLEPFWSEWFNSLTVEATSAGETLLTGPVRDQVALHGLLSKIRDMGLTLLSVKQLGESSGGSGESKG